MANKIVAIEGSSKPRNLKFNYNALIKLQDEFNLDVTKISERMSFKDIRSFYFCGLKWEDATLTEEQVGDILDEIIDEKGMEYVGQKLAEAVMKAFGITEADVKAQVANSKKM